MSAWRRRARTWPRRARSLARARPRETWRQRGTEYAEGWQARGGRSVGDADNPLRAFISARTEGRGIWKWDHYLDAYHRHFARFRGSEVHILEIGIFSGGSLDMWHDYFGPRCHVYGVDVEEACRRYDDAQTTVFIGDQADRAFWRSFRSAVPALDIVVDDGGHLIDQQRRSVEELLPHLRPGGIYVVEDHHGIRNPFAAYVSGLVDALNAYSEISDHMNLGRREVSAAASSFQSAIDSIHTYPFLTVIERRRKPLGEFIAPRHGTQWEPFLS